MSDSLLTAFWIEGPNATGPLGYGVTAYSLTDALEIVAHAGYPLAKNLDELSVRPNIRPADIEYRYVREHMGPIVVRGLWYPFVRVGLGAAKNG